MKKRYYVAYGSNLNIAQMAFRCPDAEIIGTGEIRGYELLFKGSRTGSYLTIEEKPGGKVPVAVWATSAADEARLDRYEGYPSLYYKAELNLPVTGIRDGKVTNRSCYIYIMHEDRSLGIPHINYIHTCRDGYRDFKFDENILYAAIEKTKRRCHEEA